MHPLSEIAAGHIGNILSRSIKRSPEAGVLVVYDRQCGLASLMADAYQAAIPDAGFIDFDASDQASIMSEIDALKPGDVVILVQSTSFRLNDFRLRIELFKRKLKTIEHVHLGRMPEAQWATWVDTLAFDPNTDGETGRALKRMLAQGSTVRVECGDSVLTWEGGMEEAKLNIGDYSGMENVGGTFPIGEVFTEARDLSKVNGELKIYAFADDEFLVQFFDPPFTILVRDGLVEPGPDAPQSFVDVIEKIKAAERPLVREFGLGLNQAISREKPLDDITAFERVYGLHLSLGEKHGVYKKPGLIPKHTRYHIDVFPAVDRMTIDGVPMFEEGRYRTS